MVDGNEAEMRISVHFAFDSNLKFSNHEEGTQVFVPGKPWGKSHVLIIGDDNDIPREQLAYLEIVITFRRTNLEGIWQVRSCQADEASMTYDISFERTFTR